jgi:hypothetical protein
VYTLHTFFVYFFLHLPFLFCIPLFHTFFLIFLLTSHSFFWHTFLCAYLFFFLHIYLASHTIHNTALLSFLHTFFAYLFCISLTYTSPFFAYLFIFANFFCIPCKPLFLHTFLCIPFLFCIPFFAGLVRVRVRCFVENDAQSPTASRRTIERNRSRNYSNKDVSMTD